MGTWGHSHDGSYIIFCVGDNPKAPESFKTWANAVQLGHKELQGYFNGKRETSFIVNARDILRVSPWLKGQTSVLQLGPCDARDRRPATLIYANGTTRFLGKLYSTTKEDAMARNAWTYDPLQDTYFVTQREVPEVIEWGYGRSAAIPEPRENIRRRF